MNIRSALCVLVCVGTFASSAFATGRYLLSGAKGKWSDSNIWLNGAKPTDPNDDIRLWDSACTAPIEVEIDGDYTVSALTFGQDTLSATETRPSIKFTGSGTLTVTGNINVKDGHHVVFDGPTLDNRNNNITLKHDLSVLEFVGNTRVEQFVPGSGAQWGAFSISGRPTIHLGDSAYLSIRQLDLGDAALIIDGGELSIWNKEATVASGKVRFVKGTVSIVQQSTASAGLFAPEGPEAMLISRGTGTSAYVPKVGNGSVNEFSGSLYATNGASATFSVNGESSFSGEGVLYANKVLLAGGSLFDAELSKVFIGNQLSVSSWAATSLIFRKPVTFGAFGDFSWTSSTDRQYTLDPYDNLTIDTKDCFVGQGTHSITVQNLLPHGATSLNLTGGGKATIGIGDKVGRFDSVEVGSDSTLELSDNTTISKVPAFNARTLKLCDNSTVSGIKPKTIWIDAPGGAEIGTGATLDVSVPDDAVSGYNYAVLTTDPQSNLTPLSAKIANAGNWTIQNKLGCVYLTDGSNPAKTDAYEWTGETGANMATAENWYGQTAPESIHDLSKALTLTFSGSVNNDVMNDVVSTEDGGATSFAALKFISGGPWRISGNKLRLWTASSIESSLDVPVIFDGDIMVDSFRYWQPTTKESSYVQFNGTVDASYMFMPQGDFRIGGHLTCMHYVSTWKPNTCKNARMWILKGGRMTVTGQNDPASGVTDPYSADKLSPYSFIVDQGGIFEVTGGEFFAIKSSSYRCTVNGSYDLRIPFCVGNVVNFDGTGTVHVASMESLGSNGTIYLDGGIRFVPDSFATVAGTHPGNYTAFSVPTWATLGATNDWTYGVPSGVSATSFAADRALKLPRALSAVTIDTEDPVSGAGHVVTFTDPIVGAGKLIKTGAGILVLASPDNSISGGVELAGGALGWTTDQELPSLSVAPGTTLACGAVDGRIARLTVNSDIDLSGTLLSILPGAIWADLQTWHDVLTVSGNAIIKGVPMAPDGYKCRLSGKSIQIKKKVGYALFMR